MASALAKQVAVCNKRARVRGLAGTLTTLDWQRSLDHFKQRCAYCGSALAWTIDHFQPLLHGGGSTHSNTVPSCRACNAWKASSFIEDLPASFLSAERLLAIRSYLEAIGQRNQEHWQRLCAREPAFARMDVAVTRLKTYCEARMLEGPIDDSGLSYGSLRCQLFGVPWDPEHYFQVTVSLTWQQQHSTSAAMRAACEDAWRVLRDEERSLS
ncbi:hypothetical protein KDH_80090 [Dictyobacter sp. S3.2.2.5]|uniref:HNH nuclease domain-containing protein n=1 Tax=Dictyobacter halimunensis TaxID=3026934 RepID=A0ABQ6G6K2_9CHLR|nr:hypothetical protein KDH_80090 [Dictyobacter sp. S3.2.2.5]